jgi:hypothetical protein
MLVIILQNDIICCVNSCHEKAIERISHHGPILIG